MLGDTALVLAAAGGHTDILETLTSCGSLEVSSDQEDRAVRAAAGAGQCEAVTLLLRENRRRDMLLGASVAAARRGHSQVWISCHLINTYHTIPCRLSRQCWTSVLI